MKVKHGTCPFSGSKAKVEENPLEQRLNVNSEACGSFSLTDSVMFQIERIKREASVPITQAQANCARKTIELIRQRKKVVPLWTIRENVESLQKHCNDVRRTGEWETVVLSFDDVAAESVDHASKPIEFLEELARERSNARAYTRSILKHSSRAWARIVDDEELSAVLSHLYKMSLISPQFPAGKKYISSVRDLYQLPVRITVEGWEVLRKRNVFPNTNKVFIAAAFSWKDGIPCLRENALEAIKRACRALGYEANLVNQNHTDNITDRIISEIRQARFVVCELTYNNRGAYYEAGFARGLGRPVFHVVHKDFIGGNDEEGKKIHFDIQQVMYRQWIEPLDLEVQLREWIEATVGRFNA